MESIASNIKYNNNVFQTEFFAILVRLSNKTPIYCHSLDKVTPFAIQIFRASGELLVTCNLDGDPVSLPSVPLGLASNIPREIERLFNIWKTKELHSDSFLHWVDELWPSLKC